jgi:hypothetical protein
VGPYFLAIDDVVDTAAHGSMLSGEDGFPMPKRFPGRCDDVGHAGALE